MCQLFCAGVDVFINSPEGTNSPHSNRDTPVTGGQRSVKVRGQQTDRLSISSPAAGSTVRPTKAEQGSLTKSSVCREADVVRRGEVKEKKARTYSRAEEKISILKGNNNNIHQKSTWSPHTALKSAAAASFMLWIKLHVSVPAGSFH